MKKIKYIILAAILVSFASCEDFLTVDSLSKDDLGSIFSSLEDAQSFIDGVYQPFMEDGFANAMSLYEKPSSDVEMVSASLITDNGRRDLATCRATSDNSSLIKAYATAYIAINRANTAIEGIKQSALYARGDETMMQLLGEAVTLRAFWYLELVKHWGDVPFKTTATKAGDDFYLPRTDRDTILTFIINDMIEAEADMKWAKDLPFGVEQVSREFTQALIARAALARGGYSMRKGLTMERRDDYLQYYEIANTFSKKVIESGTHSLTLDYSTVFTNQSKYIVKSADDMIFEIAYCPGVSEIGYVPGKRIDAGSHPYGGGGGYYTLTPSYIYSFDTLDLRLFTDKEQASVATYTKIGSDLAQDLLAVNSAQVNKWCKYWVEPPLGMSSSKGTGINWPIMRYADVLLMFAETENELNNGPTAEAREALKTVRKRAFASEYWGEKVDAYVSSVSASKEAFFNAIVDERAWEFGGELVRPFDLIRWNMFKSKIFEARQTMIQMGIDVNAGSGQYANLPDVIYWKEDPTTGKISIKGLFKRLDAVPEGYTPKDWLNTLYNPSTGSYASFLDINWAGITGNPASEGNYLSPLPIDEITQSGGLLSNEGYED